MSPRKKKQRIEVETEESEGWESLAEEAEGGALAPNPELEEALREAAEAVEARESGAAGPPPAPGEPPAAAPASEAPSPEQKEVEDRLLRLQADFENFRRRALKEKTEANQYGHQNLVKDLLSTVDNLDRAIDHAQASEGGDLDGLLQGVELVRRELLQALAKHGVRPIDALGERFDPALHEAMAQAPDASVAPSTIIEELQKGYLLRDRLVRPSRVVVARAEEQREDAVESEEGGAAD